MRVVSRMAARARRPFRSLLVWRNVLLAALLFAAIQSVAAQAPAPPPQRNFNGDAGLVLIYVKPEKTADFEAAMQKVKEALQKSDKPERKQQAASWKIFKAGAGPAGQVYAFVISPSVKNADYSIGAILGEGFPQEARTIYTSYADSLATQPQVVIPLDLANDFSK
jgi:hypothetical protein